MVAWTLSGCAAREGGTQLSGFEFAVPAGCALPANQGGGSCQFTIDGRSMGIALDSVAAKPADVAALYGVEISATESTLDDFKSLLRAYHDEFWSRATGSSWKATSASSRFDASRADALGFRECLRYSLSGAAAAFANDFDGVICATYSESSDLVAILHLIYSETRDPEQPKSASFDREADAIIRSLRRAPPATRTSYQRMIPGNP
ncbi:MAG: hypothetical protein U1E59_14530 [Amaricoccus sp.]